MDNLFSSVKVLGFDLDRTLYSETPEIAKKISEKIVEKILELKPELALVPDIRKSLQEQRLLVDSWVKVIRTLGIENPPQVMMHCSDSANIARLLQPDNELSCIFDKLNRKYRLFLATGSSRKSGLAKLEKIGIDPGIFSVSIFGDDPNFIPKTKPDIFVRILSLSAHLPQEHAYIGDRPETDVTIPKSLGIRTVLVGTKSAEADYCIKKIHDIRHLFL